VKKSFLDWIVALPTFHIADTCSNPHTFWTTEKIAIGVGASAGVGFVAGAILTRKCTIL